jgi:hypothetical protein
MFSKIITNRENGINQHDMSVPSIVVDGKIITNQYEIANILISTFHQ